MFHYLGRFFVLLLIMISAVSCALFRTWPYLNQPAQGPIKPTHANYVVGDKETSDKMFVALALSGGGSRAANFSTAVMLELKKRGVLDHVDFISSVSGGSLPAAYYALDGHGDIKFEEAAVKERMGRNLQQRWLLGWFNPLHILRYWFTDYTRSDIMVPVFDSNLFHDATYASLNPERPKLLINATDSGTFERFTFSDEEAAKLQTDLSSFRIARAVNISSAFPGAFQTITVQDYSQADTYRHLYDGGPVDNLGVDALADVLVRTVCEGVVAPPNRKNQSVMQRTARTRGRCPNGGTPTPIKSLFSEGCLVISVDAAPLGVDRNAHNADVRRVTDYIVDSNVLNATDVMLLQNRKATLEDLGIAKEHIDDPEEGRFSTFPVVASVNRCEFWHIALRHIPLDDDLGKQVHNIKTSFNIEEPEQKALFDAAKRLVEEGLAAARGKGEGRHKALKALLSQTPSTR